MNAAVWGACGFLGRHLVSGLLEQGFHVTAMVRSRDRYDLPAWHEQVEWVELGAAGSDAAAFFEVARNNAVIFDLSGSSGAVASNAAPHHSLDSICRNHLDFLQSCARSGAEPHIVFASSRLVYGHPLRLPVAEDHELDPLSVYAVHKLAVERYLRVYGMAGHLSYTICRIANPYGPDASGGNRSYGVINHFIRTALAGLPLTVFGDGSQLRDYVYVSDVVSALIACGFKQEARHRIFNIGGGEAVAFLDAAKTIDRYCGAAGVTFQPWPREYSLVESGHYVSDIRRAATLLGYTPRVSFEAGLRMTVNAYRATMLAHTLHPRDPAYVGAKA